MSKQTISVFNDLVPFFETAYAAAADPDNHEWSLATIKVGLGMCSFSATNKPRTRTLVACMLKSLPLERYEYINNTYVIPAEVAQEFETLTDTLPWPEPLRPLVWPDTTPTEIEEYKATRLTALTTYINTQSSLVIDTSPREILTQGWSALAATRLIYNLYEGEEPTAADFPLVEVYRVAHGLTDLQAAAEAILAQGNGWATADAGLRSTRQAFAAEIASLETMTEVQTAFDQAKQTVDAIVSQVMDAQ